MRINAKTVYLRTNPQGKLQPSTTNPANLEQSTRRRAEEDVASEVTETLEYKDSRVMKLKSLDQSAKDLNSEPGVVALNREWERRSGRPGQKISYRVSEFLVFDTESQKVKSYDAEGDISGSFQENAGGPKRLEVKETCRYTPDSPKVFSYLRESFADEAPGYSPHYSETIVKVKDNLYKVEVRGQNG